ncbi:MAG TPA: Uma2 family endonuclease [Mycobacteriales bacterium]|nr:Uma2 family endonuclease [Mycobacteriales bacterium]
MTTSAQTQADQRELLAWLDDHEARYEVIDGVVLVSPPDRFAHADRVAGVLSALRSAAPSGLSVVGPSYAVYYDAGSPKDFVLPDVVVAPTEYCGDDGIRVAPLLVVEVLSRSTRRRDRGEKRDIYAELGVPHYWLVDPDRHTGTVLRLAGAGYEQAVSAVGELVVDEPFPARVPL